MSGGSRAPRVFVEGLHVAGAEVDLPAGDARKIVQVLRGRVGDAVEIVDSAGTLFTATLVHADPRMARVLLAGAAPASEGTGLDVTLLQGIPRGAKMDYVVEKATELGVARIVPLASARVQGASAGDGKIERWRRLARAAAQQCGRRSVTSIDEPQPLAAAVASGGFDRVLVAWEVADRAPLRDRLPALLGGARRVALAIGPEGGFDRDEVEAAEAAGARCVSLGERILRTETAGLVLCAAVRYAAGEL